MTSRYNPLIALFIAIVISILTSNAHADGTFKWVSKNGTVVFGNKPPKGASSVKKVKSDSYSKYSSSKVLANSRAKLQNEAPPADTFDLGAPAKPAKLNHNKLAIMIDAEKKIASCNVVIENVGELPAHNTTVSFEFENGTIVQAEGPETIQPQTSARFVVAKEQLPIEVVPADSEATPTEPHVIIQFSAQES